MNFFRVIPDHKECKTVSYHNVLWECKTRYAQHCRYVFHFGNARYCGYKSKRDFQGHG